VREALTLRRDADTDGLVAFEQLATLVSDEDIARVVKSRLKGASRRSARKFDLRAGKSENLLSVFKTFDVNRDGSITLEEVSVGPTVGALKGISNASSAAASRKCGWGSPLVKLIRCITQSTPTGQAPSCTRSSWPVWSTRGGGEGWV
jgi:hypothetical protein